MSATRCVKLLLLLTLVPLALRAASLLLAGHAVPPPSHRQSTIRSGSSGDATATAATARASVSNAGSVRIRPYRRTTTHRRRRTEESALAAFDGTRRVRQADAGGWLEDDKRLAPTGSNPLHNLR